MVSLAIFLLVGFIVATIAKALAPGRDPGPGLTLLLGTVAQTVVWFAVRVVGWSAVAQPWSFFLSIGAAAVLLSLYRDLDLGETMARREAEARRTTDAAPGDRTPRKKPSLRERLALAPAWAVAGALLMGATGFVIGFYGPIRFQPWANQGPMVGIFLTGPAGLVLGALLGGGLQVVHPDWPTRRRVWILNAVNAAYGLFVLDLVMDRSWWH
jgi:uncharacterized membrane protein YeaQ/YmgE (transglycosylase-associated protein family)